MARIRTIKPEFWSDEKLAPLDAATRLVFLGLICMADDAGRVLDNVKIIDAFIFPETDETAREALARLSRMSRIRRGVAASGQKIIQICKWNDHQKIDHPSKLKNLPEIVEDQELTESSRESREALANVSRLDLGPRTKEGEREDNQSQASPSIDLSETVPVPDATVKKKSKNKNIYSEVFENFWRAYPTDPLMSKKAASEVWARLPDADREAAAAAVPAFAEFCRKTPDYRPVHACRFLSQRRFEGFASSPQTVPPAEPVRRFDSNDEFKKWWRERHLERRQSEALQ